MDWDKLKVFHAAAEAGSFTHAGEQLGLSQSAVSRQVSALEQELSVSLFHRHARGLILTEQGDLLFRTAHDVFMQLQAARAKLTDSRERPSGDLKVTTTPGVGLGQPAVLAIANAPTPRIIAPMFSAAVDSNRSAPRPAQSPTLSPTRSATTPALRGSSSGMPASTLPTRSEPTSAALV